MPSIFLSHCLPILCFFFFFFSLAFIYFAQFSPLTPQAALTSSVIVLLPGFTFLLLRGFSSCVVFFTPQKCLRQSKPGPAALPRQTRSWVGITPRLLGALAEGEANLPPLSFWGVLPRSHIGEPPHTSPMGQEGLNPARRSQTCTPGSLEQRVSYGVLHKVPINCF